MISSASVVWNGGLTDGKGQIKAKTGAFEASYSLKSRLGEEPNSSPEEFIGAAHAACYTMMLSALLTKAGTPPTQISTEAVVTLESIDGALTITKIHLKTEGTVAGIDAGTFETIAEDAKVNCPVSRALAGVGSITLDAKFLG